MVTGVLRSSWKGTPAHCVHVLLCCADGAEAGGAVLRRWCMHVLLCRADGAVQWSRADGVAPRRWCCSAQMVLLRADGVTPRRWCCAAQMVLCWHVLLCRADGAEAGGAGEHPREIGGPG